MAMPDKPPRSPLRVAVMTFGAVVLVGTLASLALLSANGLLSEHPHERGQMIGRGLGTLGAVSAAIAYLVQRKRITRG
jgi:uncharacterized membrane protein